MLNVKQGSCEYQFFIVFGLTGPGIEPGSTASVADVLSTRPLISLMSKINNHIKKKKFTGLIFLDLRKAFDMVSHDILLQKLHHYGVRGVVYNLLKSYLTERKQFVYINGSYSTTKTIQFGVP